jgi:hypothetical protein
MGVAKDANTIKRMEESIIMKYTRYLYNVILIVNLLVRTFSPQA